MLKNCDNQFKFAQFRNKMYCYEKTQDHIDQNKNKPQDFGKY